MSIVLSSRFFYYVGAALLIGIALFSLIRVLSVKEEAYITTSVENGVVSQIVSVSGVVEAENAADLAFPISDVVADVLISEGDTVLRDDVLITLLQDDLIADRSDALASIAIAEADLEELIAGPRSEARDVTESNVAIATENLTRTIIEQEELVENARRKMLSTDLEALPVDPEEDATAPVISGTYTCETEGTYFVNAFQSGAADYSFYLTGIERGDYRYEAYTEAPSPFGTCGLSIQFTDGDSYSNSDWTIVIPNTRSSSYVTNLNAYELAKKQRDNAIEAAEQQLELAEKEQTLDNAAPRSEALARAEAKVFQAEARLAAIDADLADRTLSAPFDGTVTTIDILPGETAAASSPIVTMVANDVFELTVRIPEIDVTKVLVGQQADVVFDARTDELLTSEILFISPLATEIDGVAYFEAKLGFEEPPVWLRSGLNADVNIIIAEKEGVLRLPKRFLQQNESGEYYVHVGAERNIREIPVTIGFEGNDGFVEVLSGLEPGIQVIEPKDNGEAE